MPKPELAEPFHTLEDDLIETMIAGLHEWRSDLSYPMSHSDMQACVRGILKMFQIQRLPLPQALKIKCWECKGVGEFIIPQDGYRQINTCEKCKGHGWLPGQ